jgi:hypothetical protein
LYVARELVSGWAVDHVVEADSHLSASIAVDDFGTIHVAHPTASAPGLAYSSWDGESWSTQMVDDTRTLLDVRIEPDSDGVPHIAYLLWDITTGDGGLLRYAHGR